MQHPERPTRETRQTRATRTRQPCNSVSVHLDRTKNLHDEPHCGIETDSAAERRESGTDDEHITKVQEPRDQVRTRLEAGRYLHLISDRPCPATLEETREQIISKSSTQPVSEVRQQQQQNVPLPKPEMPGAGSGKTAVPSGHTPPALDDVEPSQEA